MPSSDPRHHRPAPDVVPTAGAARLLRILALTGAVLSASAIAHLIAGGVVESGGLVAAAVVTGVTATAVTAYRLSWPVLSTVFVALQAVVHLLWSSGGHLAATSHGVTGHSARPPRAAVLAPTADHPLTAGMVAAHAVVTLAAVWWCTTGERLLWEWPRRVCRRLRRITARPPSPSGRPHVGCFDTPMSLRATRITTAPLRGPPSDPLPA